MTDLARGTERKSAVSAPHDAKNKKNYLLIVNSVAVKFPGT